MSTEHGARSREQGAGSRASARLDPRGRWLLLGCWAAAVAVAVAVVVALAAALVARRWVARRWVAAMQPMQPRAATMSCGGN